MLDRSKVISALERVAHDLFIEDTPGDNVLIELWRSIVADPLFPYKVKQVHNPPWPVPLWDSELGTVVSIKRMTQSHVVFSVDGSQIYPDRHHTIFCFLINVGAIIVPYGIRDKRVMCYSEPMVFTGVHDEAQAGSLSSHNVASIDFVNCKRQELEMRAGLEAGVRIKKEYNEDVPSVLLFDGSLIFWHLSSKDVELRDFFLHAYLALLDNLFQERIVTVWYISMPKSKELVNLVRLHLCDFDVSRTDCWESVNASVDGTIMSFALQPGTRSIVFQNRSSISAYYPNHLRPYFFYIHTGYEIGRVELPQWIAVDAVLLDMVSAIIIDQCSKGGGYPVALAEAHEQAVVKGVDRDFFYHFLQKMGIERNRSFALSRKSMKKRGMGY